MNERERRFHDVDHVELPRGVTFIRPHAQQVIMRGTTGSHLPRVAAIAIGLLLVGCAEEAPGPQFASDPIPTRLATQIVSVATPAPQVATPFAPATPVSMRDLLNTRGAVSTVFVASRDAIWSVSTTGQARRILAATPGTTILAVDSAPNAQAVAVLLRSTRNGEPSAEIAIIDAEGEKQSGVPLPEDSQATPGALAGARPVDVNWSPQGDRVLVELEDGSLFQLSASGDGEPSRIDVDGLDVIMPSWSATGEAIAFVAISGDGRNRSLRVLHLSDGTITEAVGSGNGRFVVDYAWMPDGISLLFTEGGEPGGVVSGIDLWRVDASGENRALVASAGSVAPVARISNVRPSPDGRSVAYAVLVPGQDGPQIDSVWVREIASGAGFKIATPSVASVDDIWWGDRGLVLSVTTGGPARDGPVLKALLQVTGEGTVNALWAAPISGSAPVAGTPVATPSGR